MNSICFNGKIIPENEPVLIASNRSYRYGDGLFETMKMVNGKVLLESFHFERLFSGLSLLKFEIPQLFTAELLKEKIERLCLKNNCEDLARIRLSIFRGNGGLYDEDKTLQYVIECWPLNELANNLNENGFIIDIFPDAAKSCDIFSNLKSANFLFYSMAAIYAKENKLNDCLVLNSYGNIADSTIANLFIIKNETIFTPALSEGCVNGVMRRYLLEKLGDDDLELKVMESIIRIEDVLQAEEVFLTNAIKGIRWVKQFRNKIYTNTRTVEIYNRFIKML